MGNIYARSSYKITSVISDNGLFISTISTTHNQQKCLANTIVTTRRRPATMSLSGSLQGRTLTWSRGVYRSQGRASPRPLGGRRRSFQWPDAGSAAALRCRRWVCLAARQWRPVNARLHQGIKQCMHVCISTLVSCLMFWLARVCLV
jgi:hypothetical protein